MSVKSSACAWRIGTFGEFATDPGAILATARVFVAGEIGAVVMLLLCAERLT
jgi:hypothetical protein